MLNFLQLLSKALTLATVFGDENRHYKNEFKLKDALLRNTLHKYGKVVYGYIYYNDSEAVGGTLLKTGHITDDASERQA